MGVKKSEFWAEEIVVSVDDLLIEILVRLPLKPLVRFKSVSKRWNTMISDRKFLSALEEKRTPSGGVIFQSPHRRFTAKSYTTIVASFRKYNCPLLTTLVQFTGIQSRGLVALNSCNGLLLCKSEADDFDSSSRYLYHVCDIADKKYSTLPELDGGRRRKLCGICLAFDPSKSPYYRVVCVWRLESEVALYDIEVFLSETGCWRKRDKSFIAHAEFELGVFWNGAINWISTTLNTRTRKSRYFNPDEDQVPKVMPNPPGSVSYYPLGARKDFYFGESGGHLNYISGNYLCVMVEFKVYEMKTDYSEWFVKYKVESYPNFNTLFYISTVVCGKNDEESFLVVMMRGCLLRYNFAYRTLETICVFDHNEQRYHTPDHTISGFDPHEQSPDDHVPPMDPSVQYIIT